MSKSALRRGTAALPLICGPTAWAQPKVPVRVVKGAGAHRVDVFTGPLLFARFWYPDMPEKPVLYSLHAASGAAVTRGPLNPQPGDLTDRPPHLVLWLSFEKVSYRYRILIADGRRSLTSQQLDATSANFARACGHL